MRRFESERFGYGYFDDPVGFGYRGYYRHGSGDGTTPPWRAAREFCRTHRLRTAVDLGCAKGFLVEELLAAGIEAVGYDISDYALSFAIGLPCYYHDIRDGMPRSAEAVFALGVLPYIREDELYHVLADIHGHTGRFLLVSGFYEGDDQVVSDPHRLITRSYDWWRERIAEAGFTLDHRGACFDVFTA